MSIISNIQNELKTHQKPKIQMLTICKPSLIYNVDVIFIYM